MRASISPKLVSIIQPPLPMLGSSMISKFSIISNLEIKSLFLCLTISKSSRFTRMVICVLSLPFSKPH